MIRRFSPRSIFVLGGLVASIVLLAFGVASMVVGYQGREVPASEEAGVTIYYYDTLLRLADLEDEIRKHPQWTVATGADAYGRIRSFTTAMCCMPLTALSPARTGGTSASGE